MRAQEEAAKLAKEKLEQAENALTDYIRSGAPNRERLMELARAVVSARVELLDLLFALQSEAKQTTA